MKMVNEISERELRLGGGESEISVNGAWMDLFEIMLTVRYKKGCNCCKGNLMFSHVRLKMEDGKKASYSSLRA